MYEEEIKTLIKVNLTVLASLSYCYFIASKLPKGKLRFLSLSPIFYLFATLPLQLSSVVPTGITTLFIAWLCNFKLLLFSFDRGPLALSSLPRKSFPTFLLLSCFPIKIDQNPRKTPKLPLNFPLKSLLFLLLLKYLDHHKQNLHPKALLALYSCLLYLLVDVVLGICNSSLKATLGIELELPSDEPYLSTSLQDFWGRRWNLMVTSSLRHTVYGPVSSLCRPALGPQWAPLAGVFAAFVVSGLMHELMFYYVTRAASTWEATLFFVLHGACLVVEFGVKKFLGRREFGLHWAVSGPMTVAFVVVTADWLFFPPLSRNGVDERATKEFTNFVDCVMGIICFTRLN